MPVLIAALNVSMMSIMNRLSIAECLRIVAVLVEGNSIRATCRITGSAKNTVMNLLVDMGQVCIVAHDNMVRRLPSKRVQCNEIWSFADAKQTNVPDGKEEVWG